MALEFGEDIRRCFPELTSRDQRDLTRQSLQETSKPFLESAISWTASKDICQSLIYEVEGKSEVGTLIAKGNGLIFIVPYLGNWEIIQHYLGRYYKPTHR
jgi:KDO2-lipid IV(A) lauroyltransferase